MGCYHPLYRPRKELGKSINTDEAAALGAVYQAAHISPGFKVKTFIVKDANLVPIAVRLNLSIVPLILYTIDLGGLPPIQNPGEQRSRPFHFSNSFRQHEPVSHETDPHLQQALQELQFQCHFWIGRHVMFGIFVIYDRCTRSGVRGC